MNSEAVKIEIGMADVFGGAGSYSLRTCYWTPAIVEHTARLASDGSVHLVTEASSTQKTVASANNTQASTNEDTKKVPVTMDFLTFWLKGFVASNVTALAPDSQYPTWGLDSTTMSAAGWKYYDLNDEPNMGFRNPSGAIVQSFNELLFRAAIAASNWTNLTGLMDPGLSPEQNVIANQTSTRNVYSSDLRWYAAATGVQLLAILATLPLFWGWWHLQQDLDLSPFDVALAFDAHLLKDATPGACAGGIVRQLGDMRVQYGKLFDEEESRQTRGWHGEGNHGERLGFSRRD